LAKCLPGCECGRHRPLLTPEERERRSKALTPERAARMGRRGALATNAKLTSEQKRANGRKAALKVPPEQRRENARKGARAFLGGMTPDQRREWASKGTRARNAKHGNPYTSLTLEHRTEIARKGGQARGLALAGHQPHNWQGEEARAYAVHQRLRRRYGSAALYACVECGLRRERGATGEDRMDWSYDGYAPEERRDGTTRYTTDTRATIKDGVVLPLWYSPRCASHCHFLYDYEHGLRG
jgi:general stress protein YciG